MQWPPRAPPAAARRGRAPPRSAIVHRSLQPPRPRRLQQAQGLVVAGSSTTMELPELIPERFDVQDVAGFKAHLTEHGYACVKNAASPAELATARELLWQHLEGTEPGLERMQQARPLGWRRGDPKTWTQGHGDGAMTSTTHCDAMWFVRTLPGVVGGFQAAYGTQEVVAAYDRMMINLPTSTGNEASLAQASRQYTHGKLNAQGLHTHWNQDGYGDSEFICYAILSLWDMNRETGATAIVPGSVRSCSHRTQPTAFSLLYCCFADLFRTPATRWLCDLMKVTFLPRSTRPRKSERSRPLVLVAGRARAKSANGLAQVGPPVQFSAAAAAASSYLFAAAAAAAAAETP